MCEGIESLVNICTKCNCPINYEKRREFRKNTYRNEICGLFNQNDFPYNINASGNIRYCLSCLCVISVVYADSQGTNPDMDLRTSAEM